MLPHHLLLVLVELCLPTCLKMRAVVRLGEAVLGAELGLAELAVADDHGVLQVAVIHNADGLATSSEAKD